MLQYALRQYTLLHYHIIDYTALLDAVKQHVILSSRGDSTEKPVIMYGNPDYEWRLFITSTPVAVVHALMVAHTGFPAGLVLIRLSFPR